MKIPALAFALIGALLVGCEKQTVAAPVPVPVPKQQKIIFDVQSVSCTGSSSCAALNMMNQGTCMQMSESLKDQMADGWRVISSSPKEKVAQSGNSFSPTVTCIGTEYIVEK